MAQMDFMAQILVESDLAFEQDSQQAEVDQAKVVAKLEARANVQEEESSDDESPDLTTPQSRTSRYIPTLKALLCPKQPKSSIGFFVLAVSWAV
jgi:hypothetical protein